jgi:8-oxo-dGTP diphosphatase
MPSAIPDISKPPLTVVAAVIERDGRILITQRRRNQTHPLKWEFPGGKVEPAEDTRQALARELHEELLIHATIGEEIDRYEYHYPGKPPIRLVFFRVTEFDGEPVNRIFEHICWERPANLLRYDFLDGDLDFIRRLART